MNNFMMRKRNISTRKINHTVNKNNKTFDNT